MASTQVVYPTGRSVAFTTGIGLHDISMLASGNGWSGASITAQPSGTQATATLIRSALTLIAVCATANDAVALPPATGGQLLWLFNGGAAAARVYGANGATDTINGTAGATGVSIAAGKGEVFFSPLAGAWFGVLSA